MTSSEKNSLTKVGKLVISSNFQPQPQFPLCILRGKMTPLEHFSKSKAVSFKVEIWQFGTMWFLAYKSPFLQGTYTFLRFSDLLTPIGVTSFNLGPGTVFSYNDLWMILPQLTVTNVLIGFEIELQKPSTTPL